MMRKSVVRVVGVDPSRRTAPGTGRFAVQIGTVNVVLVERFVWVGHPPLAVPKLEERLRRRKVAREKPSRIP